MRAPRASSLQKPRTQTQTLTRRHMIVIKDYDHMKIMDESVKWMYLAYLLFIFSLNLRALFCTSTFIS